MRILVVLFLGIWQTVWAGVAWPTKKCNHAPILKEVQMGVDLDAPAYFNEDSQIVHSISKRQSDREPIRFHIHYHETIHNLPTVKRNLIKDQLVNEAVSYWQNTLSVVRGSARIRLVRGCNSSKYVPGLNGVKLCSQGCLNVTMCGGVPVPEEHLAGCNWNGTDDGTGGPGVPDTDYILYVSAIDGERCGDSSVAYASYCDLERNLDRPVAGYINICPSELSTHESRLRTSISVIKHEMAHSLGFSLNLFAFFRDSEGVPWTERKPSTGLPPSTIGKPYPYQHSERVVKDVLRPNWWIHGTTRDRYARLIVTPAVRNAVRTHFNCSSLEGAELEDGGGQGTSFTHWEKRVFGNEALTGVYTHDPVISNITLSLMYDTGWYGVNFSMADRLEYGRGLGCAFAKQSCLSWLNNAKGVLSEEEPFCQRLRTDPMRTRCTRTRRSLAVCNLMTHSQALPVWSRYFSDPSQGGRLELADYCPVVEGFDFENNGVFSRGSDCYTDVNQPSIPSDFAAEGYGPNSVCIEQSTPFSVYSSDCTSSDTAKIWGAGCYRHSCSSDSSEGHGGLSLYVREERYSCPVEGGDINVLVNSNGLTHAGRLVCPTCSSLCSEEECRAATSLPVFAGDSLDPCSSGGEQSLYHKTNIEFSVLMVVAPILCSLWIH